MIRNFHYQRLICAVAALSVAVGLVSVQSVHSSQENRVPAKFIRGINLNGPALQLDGNLWQGSDSPDYACNGNAFESQNIKLSPATDPQRAKMLRSSQWGSVIDVELKNLEPGSYRVHLYVWEDNNSEEFKIMVNDRTVIEHFLSGKAGEWKRLGPWQATAKDGKLKVSARGGAANFSGIEVWSATGDIPELQDSGFNRNPSGEEIAFFESKIRPLLVQHCYECHSVQATEVAGALLVDSSRGIARGGDTGQLIVPRDADNSLLLSALRYQNVNLQMPPTGKLADHEIEDVARWIAMGAPDPRTEDTVATLKSRKAIDWEKGLSFWSLQPLHKTEVPAHPESRWPFTDIDRFTLKSIQAHNLKPSEDASKEVLIRRATYDLTGLPPSPEEIDLFIKDESADAFAQVLDRLLASRSYAERWGRHWLDVVRYSDTAGDNSDFPIPQMIKYRDWVIDAFDQDLPYDEFIRQQIAGDLMQSRNIEDHHRKIVATGYIAGARRFGSRVDDYPQHLTIEDTLDNLGRAFLATTLNCARCHDHKFDPISNEDYYALYGVFNSTRYPWPGIELDQKQRDLVPLVSQEIVERVASENNKTLQSLKDELKKLDDEAKQANENRKKELEEPRKALKAKIDKQSKEPLPFEQAYSITEASAIGDSATQLKGDPAKTGETVPRHFLTMLGGMKLADDDRTSGRLALADWIADAKNPMTPRVMVNRIWLYHFGRGLVPTPNDFGRQGKPPSHPELLDYLALRFIDSGWSIKQLHRDIMLSHTYRLSSDRSVDSLERDPSNEWICSFPRRRMDAESIRDTLLLLGGNLDRSSGGVHPFPTSTEWNFTQHNPFKAVYVTNRRSVYMMTQRTQRHPFLAIFDGADPAASTPMRMVSTSPLQALYFMNDPFVHEQASLFAKRIRDSSNNTMEQLDFAFRNALGRKPSTQESESSIQFLDSVTQSMIGAGRAEEDAKLQALAALVRSMFRWNEFVYVD